jgi:hypothetical protein
MPQGERKYSDFDQVTSQPQGRRYSDFDQVTTPPQPQQESWYQWLRRNVGIGAENVGQKLSDSAMAAYELASETAHGNFQPAKDTAALIGHGVQRLATSLFGEAALTSPEFGGTTLSNEEVKATVERAKQEEANRIAEIKARQAARREASGDVYWRGSQIERARLAAEEAKDQSRSSRIVRGATEFALGSLPYVATGIATGGSAPALAATGAVTELGEPENIPLAATLAAAPVPVVEAAAGTVAPLLRKLRSGRTSLPQPATLTTAEVTGAKPILSEIEPLEAIEALPTLSARTSTSGPKASFDADLESIPMESLIGRVETPSLGKAIGKSFGTTSQAMRTLWTSMDMSSPLSQGAVLSIAHPVKASRAFKMMFKSLSKRQSELIDSEIINHPLLPLAEDSGLYVATSAKLKGQPEEFFALEWLNRQPGIRHSERTFRTYLDTLRLSVWESYVKAFERAGLTPQANPTAYRQAAEFINIATGRGVLAPGGKLAKAMDLGGDLLFAPRNLISNFQLLDPIRYATLAPGARKVVLRDATTAFGAMLGTAALLRLAGAGVGFDPEAEDFMQARIGDTRYDLTFGKKTQVQFLAKALAGTYRQATGAGNLPGKAPLSVAERFARGKLAPLPGLAYTGLSGRDFTGEPLADKSAAKIAWQATAPLLWRDLAEAYEEEGAVGVAKSSPAFFGARVSTYADRAKPAWIETPETFSAETERLGMTRSYLEPDKGENPAQFTTRKAKIEGLIETHGPTLLDSPQYRSATPDAQRAAIGLLNRRAKSLTEEGKEWEAGARLSAASIFESLRRSEERKERR